MSVEPGDALTQIILAIFRLNSYLLEKGDILVAPLKLTSSSWRVIGAIALSNKPLTCQQIISNMGITRQGAQKQINKAMEKGLISSLSNPRHKRAPLYELTELGKISYEKAMEFQKIWVNNLVKDISSENLKVTLNILSKLNTQIQTTPLPKLI